MRSYSFLKNSETMQAGSGPLHSCALCAPVLGVRVLEGVRAVQHLIKEVIVTPFSQARLTMIRASPWPSKRPSPAGMLRDSILLTISFFYPNDCSQTDTNTHHPQSNIQGVLYNKGHDQHFKPKVNDRLYYTCFYFILFL